MTGWRSCASTPRAISRRGWTRPSGKALLEDAAPFLEEFHARVVRTGFEQWFPAGAESGSAPAAWKQNMIVLLLLYPVVFLFGLWVQTPLLMGRARLPFWFALFIGNVISVLLLNWLVPWVSRGFDWWLAPARDARRTDQRRGRRGDPRALRGIAFHLLASRMIARAPGMLPAWTLLLATAAVHRARARAARRNPACRGRGAAGDHRQSGRGQRRRGNGGAGAAARPRPGERPAAGRRAGQQRQRRARRRQRARHEPATTTFWWPICKPISTASRTFPAPAWARRCFVSTGSRAISRRVW